MFSYESNLMYTVSQLYETLFNSVAPLGAECPKFIKFCFQCNIEITKARCERLIYHRSGCYGTKQERISDGRHISNPPGRNNSMCSTDRPFMGAHFSLIRQCSLV